MNNNIIIVMAGGLGKRMKSRLPKVIHKVNKIPMIVHVLKNCLKLNPQKILVVTGKYKPIIKETIENYLDLSNIEFINQPDAKGTGHAIQCCRNVLLNYQTSKVLILSGDVPLVSVETMKNTIEKLNSVKIVTVKINEPKGLGRIVIDDKKFVKIVEDKDCNEEEKKIKITNSGIYGFDSNILYKYLPFINNKNAQNEYYLTDIVEIIKNHEKIDIDMYMMPENKNYELTGVNTKEQLEYLNNFLL
tara:strand:- start:997 stop:1734 length:738 start_codon:yes stop_codon:yes gene_type:complete